MLAVADKCYGLDKLQIDKEKHK